MWGWGGGIIPFSGMSDPPEVQIMMAQKIFKSLHLGSGERALPTKESR